MTTSPPGAVGPRAVEVAALGARTEVVGFALAGAHVLAADDADAVRAAWRCLPPGVGVVLLTPSAAAALAEELAGAQGLLTAVIPG